MRWKTKAAAFMILWLQRYKLTKKKQTKQQPLSLKSFPDLVLKAYLKFSKYWYLLWFLNLQVKEKFVLLFACHNWQGHEMNLLDWSLTSITANKVDLKIIHFKFNLILFTELVFIGWFLGVWLVGLVGVFLFRIKINWRDERVHILFFSNY